MNENEQYMPSQDLLYVFLKEQITNTINSFSISDYQKWVIVSTICNQLEPLANKQIQTQMLEYQEKMQKQEKKEVPSEGVKNDDIEQYEKGGE